MLLSDSFPQAQLAEFKSAQPTPRENRRETSPQEQGEQEQQPVQVEWEPPQEQVDGEALHEEQQVDGEQAPQGAPLDGEPELETELEVEGTLESAQEEGEKSSEADMVEPASRVVLVYGPLTFVMGLQEFLFLSSFFFLVVLLLSMAIPASCGSTDQVDPSLQIPAEVRWTSARR